MQQIKKRQIHAQAKGQEHSAIDELESRIVQQENEISNMETRNFFSLHCAQLETQLVHANLNILHVALKTLVSSQVVEHEGVSRGFCFTLPSINEHEGVSRGFCLTLDYFTLYCYAILS